MPVADWKERSRINFQDNPPNTAASQIPPGYEIELITFELNGATTGVSAGLTSFAGVGVAWAVTTTGVLVLVWLA